MRHSRGLPKPRESVETPEFVGSWPKVTILLKWGTLGTLKLVTGIRSHDSSLGSLEDGVFNPYLGLTLKSQVSQPKEILRVEVYK